ncbi:hypothetical protein ACHAPW_007495 [Verticillium nonalfalfae]
MNPFDVLSVEESVRIREKKRAPGGVEDITPAPRQGGGKVEDVDGLVAKLKELGAI